MPDNPLEMTPEREARIRKRAYSLWEEQGRPEGRDEELWERAKELIGMENDAGRLPNPMTRPAHDESPVEEAEIQANYGEFPDRLTDQGDRQETPSPRRSSSRPG